nr:MAG TPA: hypothetical protein [Caudoviricetes sp.]
MRGSIPLTPTNIRMKAVLNILQQVLCNTRYKK